ncbi:ATP-binding response regulator [Actibacterium lipolyticum]|uniref:histidine kinase n=1 Tax=Actibacterium lipolyticum TaxID=1524263 RepID=A0A238JQB5_9RHOB|nr:PAS-domain containing protein [Actibacterium lipolyticum]SMX32357.1 Autoinducer 2 sensor kinase/phosphatase LuxQ [Actibacterium lipolyticum]
MIDPSDPLELQVEKQAKIIEALLKRANREHDVGGSAYTLFQSAIALQGEVWEKTRDLERALDTLGQASHELEVARFAREQTQKNLAVALDVMEGGFALFVEEKMQVCNDLFKNLLPDIAEKITPGLELEEYFDVLDHSTWLEDNGEGVRRPVSDAGPTQASGAGASFVLELRNDRWFQISQQRTSPDNIIVLQTEITEIVRKNRSEKDQLIDQQAHFLQAAFDHMSLGICTFSADGRLLLHNARFGELLALPYTLVQKGTTFRQILQFIKKNQLLVNFATYSDIDGWMDRLRYDGSLQERIRHANGAVVDLHVHWLPDGGFLVNIMDVTVESQTTEMLEKRVEERTFELTEANKRLRAQYEEQAKVEEELRLAKEEAESAVSSKTRFLAAASHDLLQPINAAKLFISTLMEFSRGTNLSETVERLDGSFTSIESLLHALLDISRLDSTGTEISVSEFGIGELLHSVKEDYAPLAEKKGIRLDIVRSSIWVRSDQRYLLRSVQNLIVNAIQYTDTGRVLVGCRRRGDVVVLEVWDTGIGISRKDQKRVFNEFTRADNVQSGTGMGLGLSIVERACRHLGHKIHLRSKPKVGSVFSIEMPIAARPADLAAPEPADARYTAEAEMDLIVVIVENDADVLFATTQRLENWGASVLGASSTLEAVALVRDIGMAPDIILADYQLDDDDTGIKAITALRQVTGADIPAIMITADRGESLISAGVEHGFTVLTKPVQLSRLRPLIDWKTRPGPREAIPTTDKSIE